jgi:hypothetical protein
MLKELTIKEEKKLIVILGLIAVYMLLSLVNHINIDEIKN